MRGFVAGSLALAALVGHAPAPAAQRRGFGVREVLSAPFASELMAAPTGGRAAWLVKQEGVRNVWVAAPPDYAARKVTAYAADDGQELASLAWTPGGSRLVYVRGGDPNRAGERPNPLSDPAGGVQALYVVAATGGEPRKLAEGQSPAVSPRGDRMAFLKDGQIFAVPLDGGGEAVQLVKARGSAGSLGWSPDGTKLAFVSDRGAHSFVGVYDTESATVRWLDPGLDQDQAPAWSPDGRSVAFLRLPSTPKAIPFVPERSGPPWSIRIADAATGLSRELWRASTGVGSVFRALGSERQLFWTVDDRLVFPWRPTAGRTCTRSRPREAPRRY